MYFKNDFSNSLFRKGHRTITLGTVISGAILFFIGISIFAYPALIAYFVATVILFTGLSALLVGWKLWKFRKEMAEFEKFGAEPSQYRSPWMKKSHITYIRW
jgi:Ca2+/Na+ antiporter